MNGEPAVRGVKRDRLRSARPGQLAVAKDLWADPEAATVRVFQEDFGHVIKISAEQPEEGKGLGTVRRTLAAVAP